MTGIKKPAKFFFFTVISFFIFFLFCPKIHAATYYIDPDCANNGNGTTQDCAAGAGLAGAYNTWTGISFSAGNSYLQKRGTSWTGYFNLNGSGSSGNEITLGAYGTGDDPIIREGNLAGSGYVVSLYQRSFIIIENLNIKENDDGAQDSCIGISRAHDITIRNNTISDCDQGIGGTATNNYDVYNLTIENNQIHDNNLYGIWANYGDTTPGEIAKMYNITISNNEFYQNGQAIKFNSVYQAGGSDHYCSGVTFTYNHAYSNGPTGTTILFSSLDDTYAPNLIAHNTVHDTTCNVGTNCNGIWIGDNSGTTVEYNESYNAASGLIDGVGIFLDKGGDLAYVCHDNIVRYNISYNQDSVFDCEPWGEASQFNSAGIGLCCGVHDNEVYSNISYGNATGVSLGGTSYNNNIYNNTFVDNRIGFYYDSTGAGNTSKNNLIADNTKEGGGVTSNWGIHGDADATNITSDYNAIYNNETNTNLHTEGSNSVYTNTYLNSNYTLAWNSPAIDAGTDLGLTTDYAGNPIYGTPDIGAYEYQPPYAMGSNHPDTDADVRIY
ncbi:MAG: right-handed parallel beta-helix repeat-containing protein, partial [Patescibacteria group bacterium]